MHSEISPQFIIKFKKGETISITNYHPNTFVSVEYLIGPIFKFTIKQSFGLEMKNNKPTEDTLAVFRNFLKSDFLISNKPINKDMALKDLAKTSEIKTLVIKISGITKSQFEFHFLQLKKRLLDPKTNSQKENFIISEHRIITQKVINKKLGPFVPKLTKPSYSTNPPYNQISKMSFTQLQNVKNFEIIGHFGKIEFLRPVDLTFCNLNTWVTIKKGEVKVFSDSFFANEAEKPRPGQKINVPALATFFNIQPDHTPSTTQVKQKITHSKNNISIGRNFLCNSLDQNQDPNSVQLLRSPEATWKVNRPINARYYSEAFDSSSENRIEHNLQYLQHLFFSGNKNEFTESEASKQDCTFLFSSQKRFVIAGKGVKDNKESSAFEKAFLSGSVSEMIDPLHSINSLDSDEEVLRDDSFEEILKMRAKKMGGVSQGWNIINGEWKVLFYQF